MVDERIAVVLPVLVDLIVPLNLVRVNCVASVPSAHVCFHPWSHVPLIGARDCAASPCFPIGNREIEIGASQITFEVVWSFKALTDCCVSFARAYLAPVGAYVGFSARFYVAERKVTSEPIYVPI